MTKQINYSLIPREDILDVIPKDSEGNVLEVGCANGVLGIALKQRNFKHVFGIEINKDLAEQAKKIFDEVYVGDAETLELPFETGYFDVIVCADVIEHLKDPDLFLHKYRPFLKNKGYIVISIPNVQYYFSLWSLLNGEWNYVERGIFDKTHLRFFTLKTIKRLLEDNGLEIIRIKRNYRLREQYCSHQTLAKLLSLYFFRNFMTFQFVILARKR